MATRQVTRTIKQIYEALAQNGFEHLRGEWFDGLKGKKGGCVLAQTAMNLGVFAYNPYDSYNDGYDSNTTPYHGWASKYYSEYLEDFKNGAPEVKNLQSVLDEFDVDPESQWFIGNKAGYTIIHWNDARDYNEKNLDYQYRLKTYQEVAQMARDILEPYFDQKVQLTTFDYWAEAS
jgi:hypothetical protein